MTTITPPTSTEPPVVTVIIPTLAEAARRDCLLRAIDCILRQEGVSALPLVVINGKRFDPGLRAELEARPDVQVEYLEEGNVTKAQARGAALVGTPFFSFLDDDDLYTPDALAHRLSLMEGEPAPDVVVTNSYMECDGERSLLADDLMAYADDPLYSIFQIAWMHSTNHLFRTSTVGAENFENSMVMMEWTRLGIRLARTKRIAFSNHPTAIYFDTPNSVSKGIAMTHAMVELMEGLDKSTFPARTRRLIDQKYTAGLHKLVREALWTGDRKAAWKYHLACFSRPAGWRYLSFTRKLVGSNRHTQTEIT